MGQKETKTTNQEGRSPSTGLTAQQEKCAVMLAAGMKVTDVAEAAGISRNTIYRWLTNIPFTCFLNLTRKEIKNQVEGSIIDLQGKALDSLKASLDSQNESVKLRAATWIVERISQLEVGETDVKRALLRATNLGQYNPDGWVKADYHAALKKEGIEP